MHLKKNLNHKEYIKILRKMSPEKRLLKCFELSDLTRSLFLTGLRMRFPNLSENEIKKIYIKRLNKCHNTDYIGYWSNKLEVAALFEKIKSEAEIVE